MYYLPVKYDVVALGNAIMDVIAQVDDDFLISHDIPKARTNLIDEARCDYLYNALPATRIETSGGSAGNTIAGLHSLGGSAAFLGKVADDAIGAAYVADMKHIGADFFGAPLKNGPATARSMIAVTPDGERSMNTFLGASTEFAAADVDAARHGVRRMALSGRLSVRQTGRQDRLRPRLGNRPPVAARWRSPCRTFSASTVIARAFSI